MVRKVKERKRKRETIIVHCKRDECDIYIGRPSKWGNPFSVLKYGREGALKLYRRWVKKQEDLMKDVRKLRGKRLGCWCAPEGGITRKDPLICHGQILAKLAHRKKNNENKD